jgi:hypothetical protein
MKRALALCWLLIMVSSRTARADLEDPYGPYGHVDCDTKRGIVTIVQGAIPDHLEVAHPIRIELWSLLKYRNDPKTGEVRLTRQMTKRFTCTIAGVKYRLAVSAWKANFNIEGMCGGDDPVVGLAVIRKGKSLLPEHFRVLEHCLGEPRAIKYLRFSEAQQDLTVGYFPEGEGADSITPPSIVTLPYARLKFLGNTYGEFFALLPATAGKSDP